MDPSTWIALASSLLAALRGVEQLRLQSMALYNFWLEPSRASNISYRTFTTGRKVEHPRIGVARVLPNSAVPKAFDT